MADHVRVLFVCLGNICRSPTAEGVMKHLVEKSQLDGRVLIDSAGTGDWHIGEPADRRMRAAAKKRGFELTSISRQVQPDDFEKFDRIVAMDRDNLADLTALCPPKHQHKLELLRSHDEPGSDLDVPDPYYGGPEGFDRVMDIVERCCSRLLTDVRGKLDS